MPLQARVLDAPAIILLSGTIPLEKIEVSIGGFRSHFLVA